MSNFTRVWAPLVTALCSLFVVGALGCSSNETTPAGTKPVATCSANEGLPDVKGKCVQTGIAPSNCAEGFIGVEGRDCEPVLPFDACAGGTMPVVGESTCQTVGVPDGKCGTGFESDGNGGCTAIFPASPCAKGTMAIPGESACHEVSPCGSAPWGDIPVEATTQYVDASFAGTSDGSASKPWTTVQQAIDAAESGAIVAIADGSYVGSLMVKNKPVRLWGRCPASVELKSASGSAALATVRASGTEIHALAMTGPGDAVAVQAATGVLLDHVWVHDTGYSAVYATGATASDITVTDSLIEETPGGSVYIVGSSISIARTMMRQSASTPDGLASGPAVVHNNGSPGHLTLQQSAIDGAEGEGIHIGSSTGLIEDTLVRGVFASGTFSEGITIESEDVPSATDVTIRGSVVKGSVGPGVFLSGGHLLAERLTVQDSTPVNGKLATAGIAVANNEVSSVSLDLNDSLISAITGNGVLVGGATANLTGVILRGNHIAEGGYSAAGLAAYWFDSNNDGVGVLPSVKMTRCLVEENEVAGVSLFDAECSFEQSTIRNNKRALLTVPESGDPPALFEGGGIGIAASLDTFDVTTPSMNVRRVLVDGNATAGILLGHSSSTLEGTVIRGTLPANSKGAGGAGIFIAYIDFDSNTYVRHPGTFSIKGSQILDNYRAGIFLVNSDITVENTSILGTKPQLSDNTLGDGVVMRSSATLSLRNSRIANNARTGVSGWGSNVALEGVLLECNQIDIASEIEVETIPSHNPITPIPTELSDLGSNLCLCNKAEVCRAATSSLQPPEPVAQITRLPEKP